MIPVVHVFEAVNKSMVSQAFHSLTWFKFKLGMCKRVNYNLICAKC